jgi:phosphatidylglycerophosphatase A
MKNQTPPLLTYLETKGITLQALIDCALEMYVPHPGIETEEKATAALKEEFLDVLGDVNISILEWAAFHAQEDAENGLIPGLRRNASKADRAQSQTKSSESPLLNTSAELAAYSSTYASTKLNPAY